MEIATKCPICETLNNSVSVYPSNVDANSFSTEVFSARRLPDRRHYQWVRCNSCTLLRSDPVLDVDLEVVFVGVPQHANNSNVLLIRRDNL